MMFEWKKEYEIGHLMLDREYQKIFAIASEAFSVVDPNKKKEKIIALIKKLTSYLSVHIQHEEDFMRNIEYPQIEEQHKNHQKIIEDFEEWKKNLHTKSISVIEKELAFGIEQYIINHIKHEDTKIRQWCQETNIDSQGVIWKDCYKIGNEMIDAEHKHLFEVANEAFKDTNPNEKKEKIKHIMHELHTYITEHFIHEEELMKSVNYPKIKEHIGLHNNIIEAMNNFTKKIHTMPIKNLEKELAIFIEEWLVLHIIHEDKKIARYLVEDEEIVDLQTGEVLHT